MDASGRMRAEEAQAHSERRLRALFDSAVVGIAFGAVDGTIFEGNEAFLRITGYSREDFLARRVNVRDITPPEQIAMTDRALDEAQRGAIPPYEKEYIRKDGTRVPVLVNLGLFPGNTGEGFAVVLDVTEKKRAERELADRQNRLQALFDNTQDSIMLFNQFGYFIDANPAACQLLGYTRDEICKLHMYDMFPEDELARVVDIRHQVLSSGRSQGEVRRRRKDGSVVEVEYRAVANITPGVHLTVLRDISPRKQAEQARNEAEVRLAAHQFRLQALFDNSLDAIVMFDDQGRFLDLNPAACELYGWAREELAGQPFAVVLAREEQETIREDLERLKRDGRRSGVLRMQRRDRSTVEVEARAVSDIVPGVHMAVLRDLRERRESERALRNLSGRLLRLQDEERRRLAREIHDSTAQGLAALSLGLGVIAKASQRLGVREQQALADAQVQVEQSARELRTISYLLHPPLLDEMGLASALRAYVDGFSNRSGVQVTLQVPEQDTRLPGETETALFRVVQECLTNIHRHSGSPTAQVRLLLDAESVVLEVSDQGSGLEIPTPGGLPVSDLGVGIVGMQERVRQLGGRLEFDSGRTGTTVRAVLPRVDT
jgi:PAS domain S-box-containing protein